mmetsp:Transcript_29733/g.76811  ORF Transcript_29733/g.76811 Transcript_29733/m.76811 type:complete len:105 (-) Transcript_29733:979-1293(-)
MRDWVLPTERWIERRKDRTSVHTSHLSSLRLLAISKSQTAQRRFLSLVFGASFSFILSSKLKMGGNCITDVFLLEKNKVSPAHDDGGRLSTEGLLCRGGQHHPP